MGRFHDRASGPLAAAAEPAGRTATHGKSISVDAADTLSDVLEAVRLTGALFFLVDASTPWAADAPPVSALAPVILPRAQHVVSYHVVTAGPCWCRMPDQPPVRLDSGDIIVVPHGDAYVLSNPADIRSGYTLEMTLAWYGQMAAGQLPFVVEEGGGHQERLRLVCGFLGCDGLPFNPVLATLPRLLHVRRPRAGIDDRLDALVGLAAAESRDKRAGSRSVLLRLGELLFVEIIRRHVTTLTAEASGWLAGLRDPVVGRALARLHEQPSHPWTLDGLAREVGASRSVLAERFSHFVGQPPMHYLARWRIQLAAGLLGDGARKVSSIARDVGYDSEAAFSRAFKKLTGVAPVRWRNRTAARRPRLS